MAVVGGGAGLPSDASHTCAVLANLSRRAAHPVRGVAHFEAYGGTGVAGHSPRSAWAADRACRANLAGLACPVAANLVDAAGGAIDDVGALIGARRSVAGAALRPGVALVVRHAACALDACNAVAVGADHLRSAAATLREISDFRANGLARRAENICFAARFARDHARAALATCHARTRRADHPASTRRAIRLSATRVLAPCHRVAAARYDPDVARVGRRTCRPLRRATALAPFRERSADIGGSVRSVCGGRIGSRVLRERLGVLKAQYARAPSRDGRHQ
jgi:hypothetical protein